MRTLMEHNYTDEEVQEQLELTDEEITGLKRKLLNQELTKISHRPTDEIYVEHRIRMGGVIKQLETITKDAKSAKQYQAAMGAQKTIASILDNLIDRGQDMGVIPRAAKKHEVIGGVMVSTLSNSELLDHIAEAVNVTRVLVKNYGDKRFIDIDYKEEP